MTAFSATDAAFEGFRITREKPRVLLIWAGFYLIISLLMPVLLVTMGGQNLMALEAQANNPNADPQAALDNLAALGPLYAILIPMGLAVQAVLAAAVYRAILRPEDTGFGYLRLGQDELRLTVLTLIYFLLSLAAVTIVVLLGGIGAGMAYGLLGSPLFGVGLGLFFLGLLLYVAVRLSLAPVITFAERRISVFDSWALTKGQFWKLLGAYILAIASVVVVLLLAMVIFMAIAAILAGGDIASVGKIFSPDLSSVAAYYTPPMVAYTIFGGFLNALYFAVLVSPAAVAYRALKEA
ncbi:hypothetical protein M9M90_12920 [Phenylobacterium sp. LH3H17]|uniref:hypothetical protein n=1 Tax=Phenylobacterium sp. LH3H17 TaxID=2903901 RepID=UPI0020CA1533|nr:hypothetical protein [Phenylobacterium sp. LH3H17]UTP38127.1 hypothetical protein M9M90_12920 [Phenylobacterium sp. LH3H17]